MNGYYVEWRVFAGWHAIGPIETKERADAVCKAAYAMFKPGYPNIEVRIIQIEDSSQVA